MSEHLENLRDEDEQGYQDWCNARDKAEARVKALEVELEKEVARLDYILKMLSITQGYFYSRAWIDEQLEEEPKP
jgi:hypothetical protein